jgi:hypothetical protein
VFDWVITSPSKVGVIAQFHIKPLGSTLITNLAKTKAANSTFTPEIQREIWAAKVPLTATSLRTKCPTSQCNYSIFGPRQNHELSQS